MRTRTKPSQIRRLVACSLLVCYSASCASWRFEGLSPQQVVAREQPLEIRVIRSDSTEVVLTEPKVSGDSLTGLAEGKRVSVPLSGIAGLALLRSDPGKMFGIGVLTGVVLGAGLLLLIEVASIGGN
jgi:hypothetical protein